jgi:hypothetical protein
MRPESPSPCAHGALRDAPDCAGTRLSFPARQFMTGCHEKGRRKGTIFEGRRGRTRPRGKRSGNLLRPDESSLARTLELKRSAWNRTKRHCTHAQRCEFCCQGLRCSLHGCTGPISPEERRCALTAPYRGRESAWRRRLCRISAARAASWTSCHAGSGSAREPAGRGANSNCARWIADPLPSVSGRGPAAGAPAPRTACAAVDARWRRSRMRPHSAGPRAGTATVECHRMAGGGRCRRGDPVKVVQRLSGDARGAGHAVRAEARPAANAHAGEARSPARADLASRARPGPDATRAVEAVAVARRANQERHSRAALQTAPAGRGAATRSGRVSNAHQDPRQPHCAGLRPTPRPAAPVDAARPRSREDCACPLYVTDSDVADGSVFRGRYMGQQRERGAVQEHGACCPHTHAWRAAGGATAGGSADFVRATLVQDVTGVVQRCMRPQQRGTVERRAAGRRRAGLSLPPAAWPGGWGRGGRTWPLAARARGTAARSGSAPARARSRPGSRPFPRPPERLGSATSASSTAQPAPVDGACRAQAGSS